MLMIIIESNREQGKLVKKTHGSGVGPIRIRTCVLSNFVMLALISSFESGNNNSYYIGIKGDNAHGKGQLSKGIHSSINNKFIWITCHVKALC